MTNIVPQSQIVQSKKAICDDAIFCRVASPVPGFRAGDAIFYHTMTLNLSHATSRENYTQRLKIMKNGDSEHEWESV